MRTKMIIGSMLLGCLAACHGQAGSGGGADKPKGADGAPAADSKSPGGAPGANRPVPVVTTPVAKRDVPIFLEGLGNVVAYSTVTVTPLVDGRLEKVLFREGQIVHKGDLLAQIDPRPYEVQLHQAEGALTRDSAQLKAAKLDLARYQDLAKKNLIAQQQADDQTGVVGQAEGAVRVDQAAIESAKLNLEYAAIKAPIDGVTGIRLMDAGNVVHAAASTPIVMLTEVDPIAVLFTLPEDVLPQVSKEMLSSQLPVEAWSRDGSTKLAMGETLLINNQINQATATLQMKAIFKNPKNALWPNQFVKARLLLTTRKDAITVPAQVIQRGPKGTYAYIVEDGAAKMKPIEVEIIAGDDAIISSGLNAGDEVVVDGQSGLKPGAKVQSRPLNAPAGQTAPGDKGGEKAPGAKGKLTQREGAAAGVQP